MQAMREGAQDYVMKNNLARLVPAMERELREANVRRLRREAEEDMRISEFKYRHLFENLGNAAFLIDSESGLIVDANVEAERLFRLSSLNYPGNERKPALFGSNKSDFCFTFKSRRLRNEDHAKGWGTVPVYVAISLVELHDRRFHLALVYDITERKRSEEKIRQQANLLELAHDAIFVQSSDGKVQYWNKGAEQLYGWTAEEAIQGDYAEMAYENRGSFDLALNATRKDGSWSGELRKLTKTRKPIVVASSWTLVLETENNPALILVIDTDITEKKHLESQFLRAQRLELIGTLAAGIAHDLNNILQVIITNLDLANLVPSLDQHLAKYLDDASRGANRATSLARRLLTFSKGGVSVKHSLDVAEVVVPAVLLALSGSKLKPFFAIQPELHPIIGDPVQLTQVIENLVINASEAALQKGKLLIRAENVSGPPDVVPRRYVRVEIEDRGPGIPKDIQDKIFDASFTTKPHGSGLGLATVKSIRGAAWWRHNDKIGNWNWHNHFTFLSDGGTPVRNV